jgi:hypothetical protein
MTLGLTDVMKMSFTKDNQLQHPIPIDVALSYTTI